MKNMVEIGKTVLKTCMDVRAHESVLIITDDATKTIGETFYAAAGSLGAEALLMTMKPRMVSGEEPPAAVAAAMQAADVVLCPMSTSITHTDATLRAVKVGARVATMPGITEEMLTNGAMTADYNAVLELTEAVTALLTKARTARLEKDGHVLTLDLTGRNGIPSSGVYRSDSQAGNLPSGEAYIAPLENGSNGTMCIDGSMVGVGLLTAPLIVTVENGRLVSIEGPDAGKLDILLRNERNATLCELGIGTNYAARLTGVILEDEKALHTVHIAFGTNVGFGGVNRADCHMDGVIKNPTLYLDDQIVMDKGELVI